MIKMCTVSYKNKNSDGITCISFISENICRFRNAVRKIFKQCTN